MGLTGVMVFVSVPLGAQSQMTTGVIEGLPSPTRKRSAGTSDRGSMPSLQESLSCCG
jgi:hypothetical protein